MGCDMKLQTRIRPSVWKFVLFLVTLLFISSCSLKIVDCEIRPQSQNGWVSSEYKPPYRVPRPIRIGRYSYPAVSATMEDPFGCSDFQRGLPFVPIYQSFNDHYYKSNYYKLILVLDNREDNMEVDLRDLKIVLPNGKKENFATASYCETPIKEYGDCLGPNKLDASLSPVVLTKGTYAFQLTFPGKMSSGTSSIDFTDVAFGGKKNQLPTLLINKKTTTKYCPLGEHFGCN
jgi:hypothetical protein